MNPMAHKSKRQIKKPGNARFFLDQLGDELLHLLI